MFHAGPQARGYQSKLLIYANDLFYEITETTEAAGLSGTPAASDLVQVFVQSLRQRVGLGFQRPPANIRGYADPIRS